MAEKEGSAIHAGNAGGRRRSTVVSVNLDRNLDAKITNPLGDIPHDVLMADVEGFAHEVGLANEIDILKKGALVAQNPGGYENLDLTNEEKDALRTEVTKKWKHPAQLYMTVIVCSIGAAVQGWDQTGSNGANLSFPAEFGKGDVEDPESPDYEYDQWIVGLVNAAPYIASAFIGCWCSDPLNYYFGRRGTIFVSAIFLILTPIGGALSQTWEQLFITRLLLGIGMGIKGSTTPIFAAENSPAAIRGALVMTWQFWTAFGILLGTAANLAVYDTGRISWRLQIGSAFIPAVPLAAMIYLCPESPRWYIKKKRFVQAYASLKKLRNHNLLAARDLYYINAQIEVEADIIGDTNYFTRFGQLFTIPRVKRATLASWTVMIAQQMCGINIIAFYSSTIFATAGGTVVESLLFSFGFGLVNFLFALPAFFTIDTFGRRSLLLFTFPQMAWTLLAAGASFYIPESEGTTRIGVIGFFIYLFAAFYSPGEGPVPFTYSAEVFPLSHREVGMGWAVATCLFWAAVLSITFPRLLRAFGSFGAFAFYAGLNVIAFVMIFFFVPETKQRTLEELDYVFAVPLRKFMSYQTGTWLPWWIQRYVFWKKDAKLTPLYRFENVKQNLKDSDVDHGNQTQSQAGVTDHSSSEGDPEKHAASGNTAAHVN